MRNNIVKIFIINEDKTNMFYPLIVFVVLFCFSCTNQKKSPAIPETPMSIDTLALYFWEDTDFEKINLNRDKNTVESAFLEYLHVLTYASQSAEKKSIDTFLNKTAAENPALFRYYISLFEKYLYHPNSPMRNEELYLSVLQYLIQSKVVNEKDQARYSSQLAQLSKNQPGEIAADFEYISVNGKKEKLSQIQTDYLVIFFNNPRCYDCGRVKEILASINYPQVKIAAIYPDKDLSVWKEAIYPGFWINGYNYETIHQLYDLKAIPTLYLLDCNKRVLLKDATVEEILEYLFIPLN